MHDMIEHPDIAMDFTIVKKAFTTMRRYFKECKFKTAVAWIYVKAFIVVLFRFFKARTGMVIYRVNAFTGGYRFITAAEFLTLYPAVKTCKRCNYGQGFFVVQRPDKTKFIDFCDCVKKQYEKSERRFIVRGIE